MSAPSEASRGEFRRLIEQMRRRWPAIAEAADHPLAEFLVDRLSVKWELLFDIGSMAIVVGALVLLKLGCGWRSALIIYLFFLFKPLDRMRRRRESCSLLAFLAQPDKAQSLWLTPIHYRQLLAAHVACGLSMERRIGRWTTLAWLALAAMAGIYCAEFRGWLPVPRPDREWVLAGAAVWWFSLALGSSDSEMISQIRALHNVVSAADPKGAGAHLLSVHGVSTVLFAALVLAVSIAVMTASAPVRSWPTVFTDTSSSLGSFVLETLNETPGWKSFLVLLLCAAFVAWRARRWLPLQTQARFCRFAARGEKHYEDLAHAAAEQT